eukprot:GFUD01031568.1.p1 GENE.GFUD01031568.1~~GFUD01031568.1.p1  ORF type:complete len:712 (-),score=175.54 GFUD01031568.1:182-2119(-)
MARMMDIGQEEIDFVNSVCPCAGLSMLNVCRKGQTARGSDAVQNDWMLKSAEFVLSYIKPKVLWGENAPGLFDNPGKELVEKLKVIAHNQNYSFSLVKTNSELHGLPQRRMRTFYFFWKSPTVPFLEWKETKAPPLAEYLKDIPKWATFQDVYVHEGRASERFRPYQYVLQKEGMTHEEFSKKIGRGTVAKYLERNGLIDDCILWLQTYFPHETFSNSGGKSRTHIAVLEHMKNKLSQGLGYWDDSVKFMGTAFTAVISKNIEYAVHPTEDRFFSVRELLHLMGMPHDYQIDHLKNLNHICQNVPVNTAKDFADEVVKFCQGKAEMTRFSFLKQDNVTKSVVETFPPQNPEERQARQRAGKTSPKRKSNQRMNMDMIKKEKKMFKQEVDTDEYYQVTPQYNVNDVHGYQSSNVNNVMNYYKAQNEVDIKPVFSNEIYSKPVVSGLWAASGSNLSRATPNIVKSEPARPAGLWLASGSNLARTIPSGITGPTMLSSSVQIFKKPVSEPVIKIDITGPVIKIEEDDEVKTQKPDPRGKSYRCGLCQHLTTSKEYLEAHWMTDCRLTNKETNVYSNEETNFYSCSECETKVASVEAMKAHWKNRCTGFPQGQLKQAVKTFGSSMKSPVVNNRKQLSMSIDAILNGRGL